ncbi:MAG: hypothetical protein KKE57_08165, partial [Proteobacteria bacterium]|nr:hypothetical protein [Pseudomonadota bacterium]
PPAEGRNREAPSITLDAENQKEVYSTARINPDRLKDMLPQGAAPLFLMTGCEDLRVASSEGCAWRGKEKRPFLGSRGLLPVGKVRQIS